MPRPGSRADDDPGEVIDLRSPAFSDHAMMPPRLTAEDANVSPPLEWSPAPDGTAELAVVCEDLDGPGGVVTHWVVTGLDPRATSLDEGAEPKEAVWWPNSFGTRGYEGPQPPIGDEPHRYAFRVYALDDHIDCDPTAEVEIVLRELESHSTATGTLIGLFAR